MGAAPTYGFHLARSARRWSATASTAPTPAAMAIRGGEEEMASTLTHRLSGEVDELQRMTMESWASWKQRFHGSEGARRRRGLAAMAERRCFRLYVN